ncbi:MAG: T9SS type A sorting domain-containing protein [Bacteroidetes bacterium]|nr:MAG: T9SS type A sorting domain-containing protein [Bacteroidota bacterium]
MPTCALRHLRRFQEKLSMSMHHYIQVGILTAILSSSASAQNWRDLMNDPSTNFEQARASFYNEFGDEQGPKGSGWKQFKRLEWFYGQRLNDQSELPDQRLIYEEIKRAQLQQQFKGTNGNWRLLGPVEEPQNGSGVSIGRLSAICFHPTDTNQIWAGAPSGGVWKSNDNGLSWAPFTDDLPNIGVAEIIVNPHNTDTIFISTGDGSSSDTYTFGVLRSSDGGVTWDSTGLSFSVAQNRNIRRMILDSTNTNVLIAASTSGIYRTEDAGETWQQVQSGNFCDVEFKPFSHDTVYATTSSLSALPFYVSYDNGQSWSASVSGLPTSQMGRTKVAVSPAAPNTVYLLSCNSSSGHQGFYRSQDAGATWQLMSNSPNLMSGDEFGNEDGGQGWYSMELAVSPINPDEIRVGGINLWRSTDAGASFQLEAHWYAANGMYVHADHHRLEYHPITGQFYAGCDGGLYRRSHYFDGYESISSGMSITQFYRLANAQYDPTVILAGAQDNGTMRWKEDLWTAVYGGDGMEAMIHPTDNSIMYCTIQNGELHKSTNGGGTFGDDIAPAPGAWVTPFMMDPNEPDILYAASGTTVYRSDNEGSDWYEISPNLTSINSGYLIALDVAHTNYEYVMAGSRTTLYITKDLGGTWTNIKNGLPNNSITYVAFDPLDENTIWVTFSGYTEGKKVYRSTNAGETWENMSMNLPNLPVNCVEIERSSTGGVYVGTDVGAYYWDESLTEWEPFMSGLPNVIVNELEIHEPTNTIRAATYGRGLWESDTRNYINVGVEENNDAEMIQAVYPNPTSDILHIAFGSNTPNEIAIIDAYGRTIATETNAMLNKEMTISTSSLSTGLYYIADPNRKLLGRFIVSNR